jgi:hypothetical protein
LAFGSSLLAFLIRVIRIDGRRLSPKERKFICNVLFRTLFFIKNALKYGSPKGGSWKIFDNKQLANSNWQLASLAPRSFQGVATLCRPDSKNEKTRLKLSRIEALKSGKKGFDRSVDCPVELHFGFCFQQNAYGGWVYG